MKKLLPRLLLKYSYYVNPMLAKIGIVINNAHSSASECPFLIILAIVITSDTLSEVGKKMSAQMTNSASKM